MHSMKTRNGRIIAVIAGCAFILIILIWVNYFRQTGIDRNDTIAIAVRRNSNLAVALEQYAIRTIHSADAILQLVKMEYEKKGNQIDINQLLLAQAVGRDFYAGIAIIDEKGHIVKLNIPYDSNKVLNFSDRDYFIHHFQSKTDGLFISKPVLSKTIGKPVVILSRRIEKRDGSFGGTVALQIEPETFTSFYAQANLRQHDLISLIAPDGITYARRTGSVESWGEDISKSPLFQHVAENPVGSYLANDAIHNIATYFSYRKLKDYPVIATVGTAQEDVLGSYYKRAARDRNSVLVISSLVLLFSVFVCLALLHRKKNIEKIRESETKYRSIFENSQDAILLMMPDGRMLNVNPAACRAFRMPEENLSKINFLSLVDPCDPQISHFFANGMIVTTDKMELRFLRKDGSDFIGEMASTLHRDALDNERSIVIIRDITERKNMGEKLLKEQQRFQRKVTEQVIWAQEKEREVIGRELHDNVNQVLTTVKLYLEMAMTSPETREELLSKSMQLVMNSINEIRNLSRDLSAPTLGTKSLIDSITALLEMIESSSGLLISFDHSGYDIHLSMNQKLAIYRMVQEQLNNVIKHAGAKQVWLWLTQKGSDTILEIRDDGKGFDTLGKRNGIGLNNIISRAKVFNGTVKIESAPGKGCLLRVTLPIIVEDKAEISVAN